MGALIEKFETAFRHAELSIRYFGEDGSLLELRRKYLEELRGQIDRALAKCTMQAEAERSDEPKPFDACWTHPDEYW